MKLEGENGSSGMDIDGNLKSKKKKKRERERRKASAGYEVLFEIFSIGSIPKLDDEGEDYFGLASFVSTSLLEHCI